MGLFLIDYNIRLFDRKVKAGFCNTHQNPGFVKGYRIVSLYRPYNNSSPRERPSQRTTGPIHLQTMLTIENVPVMDISLLPSQEDHPTNPPLTSSNTGDSIHSRE